uniref:Uncharacterized protein n=1 Tax=Lygus hesperus TaxID=30085 RepID=A0A0A9ZBH3_LYGHE
MVPAPNYWYPGLGKSSLTQSSASHFRAVGVVQLYQDPSGSSSETEEDIPEKIYPVPTEKEQVPDETTSSGDKVLVTPKPGSDEYNSHQSSEQPGNPVVIPPKTGSGEYGKQPSNVKPNDPKKSTKSSEQHAPKTTGVATGARGLANENSKENSVATESLGSKGSEENSNSSEKVDSGDVSNEEVLPKQTEAPVVVKPNDNDNVEDSGGSGGSSGSSEESNVVDEDGDNDAGKSDDVPETKDPVTGKPVKDLKHGILFPVEYYKDGRW